MRDMFSAVAATPYAWPFDGRWNSADTALLLLGFQNGAIRDLGAEDELTIAAGLADLARGLGIPVLASQRGLATPIADRRERADTIALVGTPDWQIAARLRLAQADIVPHRGDNAFFGTELEAALRRRGVRNLLIAGLPTEGLVHATQRTANDMGFECLLVGDASKGTSLSRHTAQLRMTTFGNGLFGAVADSAAIRAALASPGKTHHA